MRRQIAQRFVEIGLRGSRDTIGILPQKNLIQVEFKDLIFLKRFLKPGSQKGSSSSPAA